MHRTPLPPLDGTWLLAMGLTLSGIALVLGLLTGPAAFASGTLGVASWEQSGVPTASIMVALAVLLVIAWRCAGEIGLDRWLLPSIGLAGYRGALVTRGSSRTTHGKNKKWAVDRHVCSRKEAGRGEVAR
jgi:hypothetical protein